MYKDEFKTNKTLNSKKKNPTKQKSLPAFTCSKLTIEGYKEYKLFDVTKFILVLPTFRLKQQSLSRTRC